MNFFEWLNASICNLACVGLLGVVAIGAVAQIFGPKDGRSTDVD